MFSSRLYQSVDELKNTVLKRVYEFLATLFNILVDPRKFGSPSLASTKNMTNDGFALCFDIDGVLLHGEVVLDGAVDVLQHLNTHNIPYLFLTNSGGRKEEVRIKRFEALFGVDLDVNALVQSHTPFQELVPEYKDKTVLVIGGTGNAAREVAEHYGFTSVVTSADIIMAHPTIWPFGEVSETYYGEIRRELPKPINPSDIKNSLAIAAILVFSSSRDWGFDAQLVLDLLMADNGMLGTKSPLNGDSSLPNHGYQQQANSCKIFFSNPDFVWVTDHKHGLRFGQGAWIKALEAIYRENTDNKAMLQSTMIGKPHRASYAYSEIRLMENRRAKSSHQTSIPFDRVTMIGDNPASDIVGAMTYISPHNTTWDAILLETGVHLPGSVPKHIPTVIVPKVKDAVSYVLRREDLPQIP